jgi:hypothetical protein
MDLLQNIYGALAAVAAAVLALITVWRNFKSGKFKAPDKDATKE